MSLRSTARSLGYDDGTKTLSLYDQDGNRVDEIYMGLESYGSRNGDAISSTTKFYILGDYGMDPWGSAFDFVDPHAKWIWSTPDWNNAPADSTMNFTFYYMNPSNVNVATTLNIVVDNEATIYLNDAVIGNINGGWHNVDYPRVSVIMTPGNNIFRIDASNVGTSPNPAGLLYALVRDSDGQIMLRSGDPVEKASLLNSAGMKMCLEGLSTHLLNSKGESLSRFTSKKNDYVPLYVAKVYYTYRRYFSWWTTHIYIRYRNNTDFYNQKHAYQNGNDRWYERHPDHKDQFVLWHY